MASWKPGEPFQGPCPAGAARRSGGWLLVDLRAVHYSYYHKLDISRIWPEMAEVDFYYYS